MTEANDLVASLTSDGSDIYLFYVLNPGTNNLVFRKCTPYAASNPKICDNANDWGAEYTIYDDITVSYPTAIVTKSTSDLAAIDFLFTDTTDTDVLYERIFAELNDRNIKTVAGEDDAFHNECVSSSNDDQQVNPNFFAIGWYQGSPQCPEGSSEQNAGIRFQNVDVAPGAKISSAYFEIQSGPHYGTVEDIPFTIYGEDVDNSLAYSVYTNNCPAAGLSTSCVGYRVRTTNSKSFAEEFPEDGTSTEGLRYRFDVTDMVQEIVCRGVIESQPCVGDFYDSSGTWASGNALSMLMISDIDSSTYTNVVNMYDHSNTTVADFRPKLVINCEDSCDEPKPQESNWCDVGAGGNAATDCNNNWLNRKKVTFDNRASTEDLTDFPTLIRLDSSKIDYSKVQNAGQDLRFVDADGTTLLDYDIETWNESGESLVWVEVPQIDATSNTDYVYMYYGNSNAAVGEDENGTWNTNFKGVWHLKEDPTTTCSGSYEICDSTSNGSHVDAVYDTNPWTASDQVNGIIDGALYLNSTDQTYGWGSDFAFPTGSSARTLEGWMQTTDTNLNTDIFGYGATSYSPDHDINFTLANGRLTLKINDDDYYFGSTGDYNDGKWHYFAMSFDGTSLIAYADGVAVGTVTPTTVNTDLNAFGLGLWSSYTNKILDELRISSTNYSGDWIEATYLNAIPDSTFVSITSEEIPLQGEVKSYDIRQFSKGVSVATSSASFDDLDAKFSSADYVAVQGDDENYVSVSSDLNIHASVSALPTFMLKANNSNNSNSNRIDSTAVVRSSVSTTSNPIYLQIYRGGGIDDWVTIASNNSTAANTDIVLTGASIASSPEEYYINETSGVGTQGAECTNGTSNCWAYFRVYQAGVGNNYNVILSLDSFNVDFISPQIVFTNEHRYFSTNTCSGVLNPINIELQNQYGGAVAPIQSTVVRITSNSSGTFTVYSDATCLVPVTNGDFTFTTLDASKTFYIKDTGFSNDYQLSAAVQSGDQFTSGTHFYTIEGGPRLDSRTRIKDGVTLRGGTRFR